MSRSRSGGRAVAWRPGAERRLEDTQHDRSQALQAARPRAHAQDRRALHGRAPPRRGADTSWELRGGVHGDTAAFANVLANLGVVAPHTGEPLTEAMVLGVGGGLGAGYILWEFDSLRFRSRVLTLGFRRQWQYPDRWARGDRRAARPARRSARDRRSEGRRRGARRAARERPAGDRLDRHLPRSAMRDEPEWRDGYGGPPLIVYERAGDAYAIDDRSAERITVPAERLAAARGAGRLLQAPADHDRPRARRPGPASGRRGRPAAAGRAPEREVGLVLAAGLAQVGADDHRHAQQEGLADGVRRRARRRQPARLDLHQRRATARTCAACTPTSSTRRPACSSATRCAMPRRPGARRRRAGTRSSTPRCRPATSCAS